MLTEQHRTKLDGIVQQMVANGESDENIRFVVGDFKSKYDKPAAPVLGISEPPPAQVPDIPPPQADISSVPPDVNVSAKQPVQPSGGGMFGNIGGGKAAKEFGTPAAGPIEAVKKTVSDVKEFAGDVIELGVEAAKWIPRSIRGEHGGEKWYGFEIPPLDPEDQKEYNKEVGKSETGYHDPELKPRSGERSKELRGDNALFRAAEDFEKGYLDSWVGQNEETVKAIALLAMVGYGVGSGMVSRLRADPRPIGQIIKELPQNLRSDIALRVSYAKQMPKQIAQSIKNLPAAAQNLFYTEKVATASPAVKSQLARWVRFHHEGQGVEPKLSPQLTKILEQAEKDQGQPFTMASKLVHGKVGVPTKVHRFQGLINMIKGAKPATSAAAAAPTAPPTGAPAALTGPAGQPPPAAPLAPTGAPAATGGGLPATTGGLNLPSAPTIPLGAETAIEPLADAAAPTFDVGTAGAPPALPEGIQNIINTTTQMDKTALEGRGLEEIQQEFVARPSHANDTPEQLSDAADLAGRNPLTRLPGQPHWVSRHRLNEVQREELRSQGKIILEGSFDINDFKLYNDKYGQAYGDDVLRKVKGTWHSLLKHFDESPSPHSAEGYDVAGDENRPVFVIDTNDLDGANEMFGQLKDAMNQLTINAPDGTVLPVGISMALAEDFSVSDPLLKSSKAAVGKNAFVVDKELQKTYLIEDVVRPARTQELKDLGLKATREEPGGQRATDVEGEQSGRRTDDVQLQGEDGAKPVGADAGGLSGTKAPGRKGDAPEAGAAPTAPKPVKPKPAPGADVTTPGQKVGDPPLTRKKGFANTAGSVGGEKQVKPTPKAIPAKRAQQMFDKQRSQVQKSSGLTKDKVIDSLSSKFTDVNAPFKRRLLKNDGGRSVVMHLDLSRGGSGEAKRQYEVIEKEIYESVPHKYEELMADYIQAERTIEVEGIRSQQILDGQKVPFIKSPGGIGTTELKEWIAGIKESDPKGFEAISTAAKNYWKGMRSQLDQLKKEGLLSDEGHKVLSTLHKHYSPRAFIQHLDPDTQSFSAGGNKITVPDSGLKRLAGGSEEAMLNNPRVLLAQTIQRAQSRIFKNRANKSLHEFVEKNPDNEVGVTIEEPVGKNPDGSPKFATVPNGMERVVAMIDGKPSPMLMPSEMAKFWVSADPKIDQDLAQVIGLVSGASILKPMATGLNPGFAIANLPRDLMHSWFVTKEYNPVLPIAWAQQAKDFLDVMPDVFKKKGIVVDYAQAGGQMDFLTTQGRISSQKYKGTVGWIDEAMGQIQDFLGWAGETSELWTRMALMKRALKSGRSKEEAAWVARTYLDFAQGGSWSKAADKAIPYLNAGIQGTRGVGRAFLEDPVTATFKATQILIAGLALNEWNKRLNKECYESISDREKTTKWIITTPFHWTDKDGEKRWMYFGIAKDQAQRIYSAVGEELGNAAGGAEVNWKRLQMAVTDFIPVDVGTSLPPTLAAFMTYVFNKDFWANDDVWKGREVSPKEEYWNTTPELWKMWGEKTGTSPERSRRAFNKVVPQNVYTYAMEGMFQQMFGEMVDNEDKEKMMKPFIAKMAELPIAKRVVRTTWPQKGKFEKLMKDADKYEIDLYDKDGEQLPVSRIAKATEEAKLKDNDSRIQNDRNFDYLAAMSVIGDKNAQDKLGEELHNLRPTAEDKKADPSAAAEKAREFKRVLERVKLRFNKQRQMQTISKLYKAGKMPKEEFEAKREVIERNMQLLKDILKEAP